MRKILLSDPKLEEALLKKRGVLNFLNLNTVWWIKNSTKYSYLLRGKQNTFFCDSKVLSILSGVKQYRGTDFTTNFLRSNLASTGKHLFLGAVDEDLENILGKFPNLNKRDFYCYNPPYIKEIFFGNEEVVKIARLIKKLKIKFVWVCVGSPKQDILANQLFEKINVGLFFNIGAAKDFLSGKKKEAPLFFRKAGLEWFYRLVTDFKTTKIKAWRSFLALFYFRRYIQS
jgi:exopolysaccharide biosynthesis WecB/TagA/CpsF family protein